MDKITVKEVPLDEIVDINKTITEFDEPYDKKYFEDRCKDKKKLLIAGYLNDKPAGYIVGYEKENDGSFYCWMAGVNPKFRRKGVLTALMNYQEDWAKRNGYDKIKIKTRNARREMLFNLIKKGFLFADVETYPNIMENRIRLEKEI